MSTAYVPVAMGGRFQSITGTSIVAVVKSDVLLVGPCSQLLVGGAGNLVLGLWDGSTVTIPVVAGQTVVCSPKLVMVATTATNIFAQF